MSKCAFVFPGQGAQRAGMGEELFHRYTEVREVYQYIDQIIGRKISDTCFRGGKQILQKTNHTQPAIFASSAAILQVLKKYNIHPDCVAGYSLGEYTALYAAGVMDLLTGTFLVNQRATAMDRASNEDLGMGVIIGKDMETVITLCKDTGDIYVSNYNSDTQVSISGKKSAIQNIFRKLKTYNGYRTAEVAVSGAFHSPYMQEAMVEFEKSLRKVKFKEALSSIVLNNTGEIWNEKDDLKKLMLKQMIEPVQWTKSVRTMLDMGIDIFVEIGPGRVLSKFIKELTTSIDGIQILHIEDMESLRNTIEIINQ